jgi:REP element-mobilizing transposase RayT
MKPRKNQQMSLINRKGAGRPAKNDKAIRHTARPFFTKTRSFMITVKVKKNKAEIRNKTVLHILKRAIQNARRQGLSVIHYTLEYDHAHLLIEAENNVMLGKGMQAFGVTFAKAINRARKQSGTVYKNRYHFSRITTPTQLKNVMNYIFTNGKKHGRTKDIVNGFNSIKAEMKYKLFLSPKEEMNHDHGLMTLLDRARLYYRLLSFIPSS